MHERQTSINVFLYLLMCSSTTSCACRRGKHESKASMPTSMHAYEESAADKTTGAASLLLTTTQVMLDE